MVEKSIVIPQGSTHRYEHGGMTSWYREATDNLFVWRDGSWHGSAFKSAEDLMESCPLGLVTTLGIGPAEPFEDDLTWLARNYQTLQPGKWVRRKFGFDASGSMKANGYEVADDGHPILASGFWISSDTVLARRAELQNKPSWESLPEWAEHLAQDECGEWWAFRHIPECKSKEWDSSGSAFHHTSWQLGEVLGDWRDTLERRPADLSEQAVTERLQEATDNVLAAVPELKSDKYKFEPLTSIEDNQEKVMKHDNGWHERGELPPVGIECIIWSDGRFPPAECKIEVYSNEQVCVRWKENGLLDVIDMQFSNPGECQFRPIRTERDELIEVLKGIHAAGLTNLDMLASAILAAGFKRGEA